MGSAIGSPLVLATVGTDHHPFTRLVDWVDAWYSKAATSGARCFVQYGTSLPPRASGSSAYLSYDSLQRLMHEASVVVCHGGPATIMEGRSVGLVPVVIPRSAKLDESVDEHQLDFCHRLAATGDVMICRSADELSGLLYRMLDDPDAFRAPPIAQRQSAVVERFDGLIRRLVES